MLNILEYIELSWDLIDHWLNELSGDVEDDIVGVLWSLSEDYDVFCFVDCGVSLHLYTFRWRDHIEL